MELEHISEIFDQSHTSKSPATYTVKSALTSLLQRMASNRHEFSPRQVQAYWLYILNACAEQNVTPSGIQDKVNIYENMYEEQILRLYGLIPYILEAWKIIHHFKDPVLIRSHLAAISVVAVDKMSTGVF